ncbi:hypothetical protein [Kribbella sp. CA-247076]|uniref:hypothetical protein n=1 Tax=Kribbella sp. CA-247076 TaxID=3239941 RepID=UPI003D91AEB4
MDRDELMNLLDQLTGVPSVELKLNVPADRRMALAGLHLDVMDAVLREVYFFDTADLSLFHHGLVVRARRTQGKDDDTVVKARPAVPAELPPAVRDSRNLKLEMDLTRGGYVVSASLKGRRKAGAVRAAVGDNGGLEPLFSKEQRAFFAGRKPPGVDWLDLHPLGPIVVVLLRFVPGGFPQRSTIEQWHYPGEIPLVELSTKATPRTLLEAVVAWEKFVRAHGLTATGPQEPKTRRALEFYVKHLGPQPVA